MTWLQTRKIIISRLRSNQSTTIFNCAWRCNLSYRRQPQQLESRSSTLQHTTHLWLPIFIGFLVCASDALLDAGRNRPHEAGPQHESTKHTGRHQCTCARHVGNRMVQHPMICGHRGQSMHIISTILQQIRQDPLRIRCRNSEGLWNRWGSQCDSTNQVPSKEADS